MEITKVVKPFFLKGWTNTFGNIVYVGNQTVPGSHWLKKSNCLVNNISQNIFFCAQQKTGLERHEGE